MANKYSRPFTPAWRWLIAASSVGAFVGGWAVLAHTPNPYESNQAEASSGAPAVETRIPASNPSTAPLSSTPRSSAPRIITPQAVPTQAPPRAPTVAPQQPNLQQPQRSTRTQRQPRMRTGGS